MVVGCCVSPQGPFIFGDHSDKVSLIAVKPNQRFPGKAMWRARGTELLPMKWRGRQAVTILLPGPVALCV